MKQFEYTTITVRPGMTTLVDELNVLGRSGWELVHIRFLRTGMLCLIKREVPSDEQDEPLVKHSHSINFPCNQSCPYHGTKEEITL